MKKSLLIIAAVCVLGAGGWLAYQHFHKKTPNNSQTSQNQNQQTQTKDPTEGGKYLVIKEWGVRIPVGDDTNAGYYYEVRNDTDSPQTNVTVFSKKADEIIGPKGKACKGEYVAYLLRLPTDSESWNDPLTQGYYGIQKDIESYKYAISSHKQYGPECFDAGNDRVGYVADATTESKFDAIVTAFVEDFNKIEKIQ